MCGIVGIIERPGRQVERATLERMNERIHHRGPDEDGFFIDREAGLGMRRLSIIDVQGGRQPIHNEDRTIWAVFNGEIYNYHELRQSLERRGHRFYTQSDTETLVHLYEEFGERGVEQLRGMFAYAIWDTKARRLLVARDRVGIKPLYYTFEGERFLFGSELKAFFESPGFHPKLNPAAVQQYLSLLYIPGPDTIFEGVHELPPAHYLVFEDGKLSLHRYWSVRYRGEKLLTGPDWEEQFLNQFREGVKSHLISEVPLGAFLSGGIDSSAIVGIMAQESSKPVETFSVGHDGKGSFQDERHYARIVAERFGTHHHELIVTTDIRDLLPKLIGCFDQPFADSSAIPNFYISELTKKFVTVALSGLGGDEIGAGYERYMGMLLAEQYRKIPKALRRAFFERWVAQASDLRSDKPWLDRIKRFIAAADLDPPARYAALLTAFSFDDQKRLLTDEFRKPSTASPPEAMMMDVMRPECADTLLNKLLFADLSTYLPGDLLTLTDRVSMYHSLEIRVPFLDHPLVELMARVPSEYKASGLTKKRLLKRAFKDLLPDEILHRKKLGFSVPLSLWLRTDLKGLMKDILSPGEIKRIPYLRYPVVEGLMKEHLTGQANHETRLWALINLVCWHRHCSAISI
jgi:asparagine synthase (glutamine-hydrolysing)